jgi:hypothetical protein
MHKYDHINLHTSLRFLICNITCTSNLYYRSQKHIDNIRVLGVVINNRRERLVKYCHDFSDYRWVLD